MGSASAAEWLLGMQLPGRARAAKWMCLTGVEWSRCAVGPGEIHLGSSWSVGVDGRAVSTIEPPFPLSLLLPIHI